MKAISATLMIALFATGASAGSYYNGWQVGSPDLNAGVESRHGATAMQPGVGDSFDRYHGWATGNPDLFVGGTTMPGYRSSGPVNIYGGFAGSPDL